MLSFIDLFCGIGGFHQAMRHLRCKCVFACDIDRECRNVYYTNYDIHPHDDITKITATDILPFDVLCAGFPCQPFSNGGNKKSFDDTRGLLFDEIIRIARSHRPKLMFLENVKHILNISNGEVYRYIQNQITNLDYKMYVFQLSPHQYGIPQQRERVYFVCVRLDIDELNTSPIQLQSTNPSCSVFECDTNSKYSIPDEIKSVLDAWNELIRQFDVGETLSPCILMNDAFRHIDVNTLPKWKKDYILKNKRLLDKYNHIITPWYAKYKVLLTKREIYGKLEWQAGKVKENEDIYNYFIQFRQSGIRVKKAKYFPTLVAIVQTPIYGQEKRYLTPRECARLQSFPDTFKVHPTDRIAYKQLGNSVNVYITRLIIESTLSHYNLLNSI